jgi:hypothetical protein
VDGLVPEPEPEPEGDGFGVVDEGLDVGMREGAPAPSRLAPSSGGDVR